MRTLLAISFKIAEILSPELQSKGGSKLEEFKAGNNAAGEPQHPGRMQMQNTALTAVGVPIAPLASLLSSRLGRPIEDKTGLTGIYNFKLQWADERHEGPPRGPDAAPSTDTPPPEQSGPSIFTALEEQLGLKLESAKGPVQVLLIDHIEFTYTKLGARHKPGCSMIASLSEAIVGSCTSA